MEKEKFIEYANLKSQIKVLENKIDELKPFIVELVLKMNPQDKTVETELGTFTMVPKRKYTYSVIVDQKESELKEAKKVEEATGIAKYEESEYLKFI